jgi:hypothetical protein
MNKSDMRCTVCKEPKNELTPSKSKLIAGLQLFRCQECVRGQKEPRFAIIMAARSEGNEAVRFWVRGHRYVGEPIKLEETV